MPSRTGVEVPHIGLSLCLFELTQSRARDPSCAQSPSHRFRIAVVNLLNHRRLGGLRSSFGSGGLCSILMTEPGEVEQRDDEQGQRCRNKDAEYQRYGEALKDGVIDDEEATDHGGDAGQHDRLGAHGGSIDHGIA